MTGSSITFGGSSYVTVGTDFINSTLTGGSGTDTFAFGSEISSTSISLGEISSTCRSIDVTRPPSRVDLVLTHPVFTGASDADSLVLGGGANYISIGSTVLSSLLLVALVPTPFSLAVSPPVAASGLELALTLYWICRPRHFHPWRRWFRHRFLPVYSPLVVWIRADADSLYFGAEINAGTILGGTGNDTLGFTTNVTGVVSVVLVTPARLRRFCLWRR